MAKLYAMKFRFTIMSNYNLNNYLTREVNILNSCLIKAMYDVNNQSPTGGINIS